MIKKILYTFILFISISHIAFSQLSDKSKYYTFGKLFYAEVHSLETPAKDSIDVLVFFRAANDLLTFSQDKKSVRDRFVAKPEIEIVLSDESGVIRKRAIWNEEVATYSNDLTNSRNDFIYGYKRIRMPNENYSVRVDLLSELGKKLKSIEKDMKSENGFANLLIAEKRGDQYKPVVLESDLPFSSADYYLFIVKQNDDIKTKALNFELSKDKNKDEDSEELIWEADVYEKGKAEIISGKSLGMKNNLLEIIDSQSDYSLIKIKLSSGNLVPGKYKLTVNTKEGKEFLKSEFNVNWIEMPLSLKAGVDYAVKMSYYICTDEEFDKIDDGSDSEMWEKLLKYWKKHDPTPNTPFNEAFAEYYKRVDYAFFNFQTVATRDGATSERGKVYILHGKPDKINFLIKMEDSGEEWVYEKQKKKFIFEQASTGKYKLKDIIDMSQNKVKKPAN